jgi:DamX protein
VVVVGLAYLLQPAPDPAAPSVSSSDAPVAVTRIEVPRAGTTTEPSAAAAAPDAPVAAPAAQPERGSPTTAAAPAPQPRVESTPPPAVPPAPAREPQPAVKPAAEVARTDPAPRPSAGIQAGSRDARWVMAQPAAAFTIQLVTLSTSERAVQYVAGQPDPGQFAIYRLQRDGRILHVVLYGSFATREQAEAAVPLLPATIGAVQPWIRTFAQVQEAARSALQQ